MGKVAFVFPGQGAQYVGMGKELYDAFMVAKETFKMAEQVTGLRISQVCFDGPEETLGQTFMTQPAIFTVSIACLRILEERGIKPDYVAGLSLGEYSALVAAGAMDFRDAIEVVKNRGRYMHEAVEAGKGAMAAIIGLSDDIVQEVCEQAQPKGLVIPANFNCPWQVVISGEREAVLYAADIAREKGARRVIILDVSGPFHSPLMAEAAMRLGADLEKVKILAPKIPLIPNVTAEATNDPEQIRECLIKQVTSPVKWRQSIENMMNMGVDRFVEVGPGTTLSGHVKRIGKQCSTWNVEDVHTLETLLDSW